MKKFLAACACLILFSFVLIPRTIVYSQRRDNARQLYADDRIIVKLKADAELASDADAIAGEIVGAPGVRAEALTNRTHVGIELIHLNSGVSVEEAVSRAKEDPRVEYAEPDYFVYAMDTVPNDPLFSQLWGLYSTGCNFCGPDQQTSSIVATQAWDITQGSDDIVAVVLDTGVDLQHEDLAANAWVNPSEIAGNGIDDDGNGFADDVNGWNFFDGNSQVFKSFIEDEHGTHVAGSIGAVGNNGKGVTGVAWRVKLMSLKFLGGNNGSGSTSNAVKGIDYAIDMRKRGVNVRVINASWGGPKDSQALRDALAAANTAGILFVCAAGNSGANLDNVPDFPSAGSNNADAFPGAYDRALPNVISVAAVDQSGFLASFSNFGHSSVSVAAPGVFIQSTVPNGGYGPGAFGLSGTSMASPHVAGIAVLLWSHEPSLTPAQVKQRIVDTSEPLPSLVSKTVRSGRADAYGALINRIAPAQPPLIVGQPQFTKHSVTIDGLGFVNGSAVIEVNGAPTSDVGYDNSFALANGTLTRLVADIGKKPLKRAFPSGVSVTVDVFNPTTGQRSPQISVTRF
jgi:subtilisin family serine protease